MMLQTGPLSLGSFVSHCVHRFVTICQVEEQILSLLQYLPPHCLLLMPELEKQAPNSPVKILSFSNRQW